MHKETTKCIENVLKSSYCAKQMYKRITVIPNKKSYGFWKMEVVVNQKYKHTLIKIEGMAMEIGHFLGEKLWTKLKGRTIKIS